jgi:hypothetical protein
VTSLVEQWTAALLILVRENWDRRARKSSLVSILEPQMIGTPDDLVQMLWKGAAAGQPGTRRVRDGERSSPSWSGLATGKSEEIVRKADS